MTVGIAALAEAESSTPMVVFGSDRLVTTHQQSRIEHERPETKLTKLGGELSDTHLYCVISGSVQLGEQFKDYVDRGIASWTSRNEEEPWVKTAAEIAGAQYRALVRQKVENQVLSPYGLELDDLSKQHQFKDDFLDDVLTEASQVRRMVNQNLVMLIGGVGPDGAGIYEVGNNDVLAQNDMGYAAIGSGIQPAKSEFIKAEYGRQSSLELTLAVMAAAMHRANQAASGVGGDTDMAVVTPEGSQEIPSDVVDELMERQAEIETAQQSKRDEIIRGNPVDWTPST